MPVYLGREEFPDEIISAPDNVVMRQFIARAHERSDTPARELIARWSEDLRRQRRALRRRRDW